MRTPAISFNEEVQEAHPEAAVARAKKASKRGTYDGLRLVWIGVVVSDGLESYHFHLHAAYAGTPHEHFSVPFIFARRVRPLYDTYVNVYGVP